MNIRSLIRVVLGGLPPSYWTKRSDKEVERLLLQVIPCAQMGSLNLGNGIVHGMRIPWDQARRVIDKLKAEGKVDYELPHDTWITVTSQSTRQAA